MNILKVKALLGHEKLSRVLAPAFCPNTLAKKRGPAVVLPPGTQTALNNPYYRLVQQIVKRIMF